MYYIFIPFLFAIVLSILLRFTASNYHFGIFKLFYIMEIERLCVYTFYTRKVLDGSMCFTYI